MRKNIPLIHLISAIILFGTAFHCMANTNEKQGFYRDLIGFWQEYIISNNTRDETAIRKIALSSNGVLTQSIVYELATQCRIWLNNDEIL